MTPGPAGPLLAAALITAVAAPGAAVVAQAVPMWFGRLRSERLVAAIVAGAFTVTTLACVVLAVGLALGDGEGVEVCVGPWFTAHEHLFDWTLTADALSVPFALASAVLIGLTGAVSARYLHREPGFARFHLLLALFGTGVELTVLAGRPPVLFFGWELVGLTSALLIAFFLERRSPVRHGLRAFLTYRACDAGLLTAVVWLGHIASSSGDHGGHGGHGNSGAGGAGEVAAPGTSAAGWDVLSAPGAVAHADALALLLLLAVLGKSALVPVGGWLPRAMEGPTPSSAIFYGAVSVHLGPYLLLRAEPLFDHAPVARAALVLVGVLTAVHATLVGRVQSDVKSALAYRSMTQVGLIAAEIGLGLHMIALLHIFAHATLRCAQILRSPSALRDRQRLEQALGRRPPTPSSYLQRIIPGRLQSRIYRHALERGNADVVLRRAGVAAARVLTAIERWQRQAADAIGGQQGSGHGGQRGPGHGGQRGSGHGGQRGSGSGASPAGPPAAGRHGRPASPEPASRTDTARAGGGQVFADPSATPAADPAAASAPDPVPRHPHLRLGQGRFSQRAHAADASGPYGADSYDGGSSGSRPRPGGPAADGAQSWKPPASARTDPPSSDPVRSDPVRSDPGRAGSGPVRSGEGIHIPEPARPAEPTRPLGPNRGPDQPPTPQPPRPVRFPHQPRPPAVSRPGGSSRGEVPRFPDLSGSVAQRRFPAPWSAAGNCVADGRGPEGDKPGPGDHRPEDSGQSAEADKETRPTRSRGVRGAAWDHSEDRPRFPADVRPIRPRAEGPR